MAELDVPAHRPGRRRAAPRRALRPARPHARRDARVATVERFVERYHIDRAARASACAAMARALYEQAASTPPTRDRAAARVGGAAARGRLFRVAHRLPQARRVHPAATPTCRASRRRTSSALALLVLGCRGGLAKMGPLLDDDDFRAAAARAAPRRAVPSCAARDRRAARVALKVGRRCASRRAAHGSRAHPLTAHLLRKERQEWEGSATPGRTGAADARYGVVAQRNSRGGDGETRVDKDGEIGVAGKSSQ